MGPAPAKINLALVVGPRRPDDKHDLVTVFQRVDLGDRITVEPAPETAILGFPEDTIVRAALKLLDAPHGWRVTIDKQVPLAAGLGGGSSDAATALRLANGQLVRPLPVERLHELAAEVGADVPFFLHDGPQLGTGDGTTLEPLDLPQDFAVLLLLPSDAHKASTAEVYAAFDARGGEAGFDERADALRKALAGCPPSARPCDAAGERPCELAARSRTARARRLPRRREWRRSDPLRPVQSVGRREACSARAGAPRTALDHGSSVVRLNEMYGAQAIEHGTSRGGRWLRQRRMWLTLGIAAFEGLLYLFDALNWWAAVALRDHRGRLLVVRRPLEPLGHVAPGELDLRGLATARPLRAARARDRQGRRDRCDRPDRNRRALLPLPRAQLARPSPGWGCGRNVTVSSPWSDHVTWLEPATGDSSSRFRDDVWRRGPGQRGLVQNGVR